MFVHRDYHPRNLMVTTPNPGVLDFQDAVIGPITYDLVSLLRDAYISWDEERCSTGRSATGSARGAPGCRSRRLRRVLARFRVDGLQRHLKVLGIFARLRHRDGKPGYVEDMPRFLAYVRPVAARYRELAPLLRAARPARGASDRAGLSF